MPHRCDRPQTVVPDAAAYHQQGGALGKHVRSAPSGQEPVTICDVLRPTLGRFPFGRPVKTDPLGQIDTTFDDSADTSTPEPVAAFL